MNESHTNNCRLCFKYAPPLCNYSNYFRFWFLWLRGFTSHFQQLSIFECKNHANNTGFHTTSVLRFLVKQISKLTEQNGQIGQTANEHVHHFVIDIFNLLAADLMREPFKNVIFVLQVACQNTENLMTLDSADRTLNYRHK